MTKKKILIVEDEANIRRGIKVWLEQEEYVVLEAEDGKVAVEMIKNNQIDLIILDVMLPYLDGFEILKIIRKNKAVWIPVIMLTAKSDEETKISGLEQGADDYITKPFSNRELVARINSQLRKRTQTMLNINLNMPFMIDYNLYELKKDDQAVSITKKEAMLLTYLIEHANSYVSKIELLQNVWGKKDLDLHASAETRTVDIHISKIRKKLADIGCEKHLKTKNNIGYGLYND